MAQALRVTLAVVGVAGVCVGSAAAQSPASRGKSPPRTAEEITAAERRAVRGSPVTSTDNESPELRELRRFEQSAFPRPGDAPPLLLDPEQEDRSLPPGLRGHWGGSGDVPDELRSPEAARRRGPPPPPDSAFLRSLKLPDIPVRWEPEVLRFIEYFSKDARGRAVMTNFLRKLGRYQAAFERILEREGAPKDLIYVAMIESGFQAKALSNKSAGGFWQFMPPVAKAYGLEVSYWVDARRDPERATETAARYFKDLFERFGSWHLAFAAFHAGYGGIMSSIQRFNSNDYWELCKHEAGLPWETTLYVPKILAVAVISKNREVFGFGDVTVDLPLAFDKVEVRAGTTLQAVARAVGASVEALADLNPELVRQRIAPDRSSSIVRVPSGTSQAYLASIERSRGAADRVETYVLRYGESLEDVAQARGVSSRDLRRLNGVAANAELRGGTTIVVPARDGAAAGAAAPTAAAAADEPILVAVPERTWSYPDRERVFYRARDGDVLEELAEVFQVTADEVLAWNNLDPNAKLHPKMVLQLFVKKGFDRSGVALLDSDKLRVVTLGSEEFHALEVARRGKTRLYYTARAGDTLAKIARRYGLEPADLARINKLSHATELTEGLRVVVYAPTGESAREAAAGRSVPPKRPSGSAPPRAGSTDKRAPAAPAGKSGPAAPKAAPAGSRASLGSGPPTLPSLASWKMLPAPPPARSATTGKAPSAARPPAASGKPAGSGKPAINPSARSAPAPARQVPPAKSAPARPTAAKPPPKQASTPGRTGGPKPPARP